MDLKDRVAIVTGAATGIGRAVACGLDAAGATVMLADTDREAGTQLARELRRARFAPADVAKPTDMRRLFTATVAQHGGLDVLINSAGGVARPCYPEGPVAEWSAALDLNLRVPMLAIQHALPHLRERGGGAIVNVASVAGIGSEPYDAPEYAAAEAGLIRLTTALGGLRAEGIRVSCVAPGWVDRPASQGTQDATTPEDREREAPSSNHTVEDVAELIVQLAADDEAAGRVVAWRDGQPPATLR